MKWTKIILRILGYVLGTASIIIVLNLSKFPLEERAHWVLAAQILSGLMFISFVSIYVLSMIHMLKNR